jgi:D-alanyl-D-alanine carboxypeptidase
VYQLQSLRALTLAAALLALSAPALTATPATAAANILVDVETGKVLHAENATYPWYPASVTKLMTTYVTLQAVKQGRITLDSLFTVSRNAMAQAPTKMGFPVGMQVTVDNALKMLLVKSANDMAVLLAEGVDGSIENFADDMTQTAHRLGMSQSNFVNPNGLPADGQITSARDLAILARALIHDFPEYDYYWHIPAIKFGRRVVRNYNKLIGRYPGADGMKTGFICASGFNLVATATRGNKRLIAVVLGAPSSAARAVKAAELLESGFTQNPLAWLTPSLGSVESLKPIEASPPNLHDEVCGGHRKKPAAEDEDDEAANDANGGSEPSSAFAAVLSSLRAPTPKGGALLSDEGPVVPVVVYTGPTRTPAQLANLSAMEAAVPHRKRPGAKTAAAKPADAKPSDTKAADAKATDAKPADAKPADAKPADTKATDTKAADTKAAGEKATDQKAGGRKAADQKASTDPAAKPKAGAHWTPTSSSTLAASPPPELQPKPTEAAAKKKQKAEPAAAKPAATTTQ